MRALEGVDALENRGRKRVRRLGDEDGVLARAEDLRELLVLLRLDVRRDDEPVDRVVLADVRGEPGRGPRNPANGRSKNGP